MPDLNGFTGSTTVLTSWGACKLHDLARLTTQRNRAAEAYAGKLAALQQVHAQELAAFDTAAAEILADMPEDEQAPVAVQQATVREAMLAEQSAAVTAMQASIDSDLAARLPLLVVAEGEPVPLQGVHATDPATSVVDVTIAEVPVEGQATPTIVKVRCAPGCLFVTESGDVAAPSLQGVAIYRVHADAPADTFVVPTAAMSVVNPTLPMFRIVAAAETCCIGTDSMVAAVVRLS